MNESIFIEGDMGITFTRNWFKDQAENNYFDENYLVKECLRRDITKEFHENIKKMVKNKEIIVGNINGAPGDGKSVVIANLCRWIQTDVLGKEWNAKCIDRDEQEFSEWVKKNSEARNEMRMIDEHSALYETGENSSTEKAFFEEYSDLFRSRYINRWYCSPTYEVDKNCVFTMEVASTIKDAKATIAYLFYNLFINGIKQRVALGYVKFDVSSTLNSKWYAEYERRKDARQAMIISHGFKNIREMMYAELSLAIFEEMKRDTEIRCKIDRSRMVNTVDIVVRKKRMMLSMVGNEARIQAVIGALKMQQEINLTIRKIKYLKHKQMNSNTEFTFKDEMDLDDYAKLVTIDQERLNQILDYWQKAIDLKKELMELD